jgi:hypothetical protein
MLGALGGFFLPPASARWAVGVAARRWHSLPFSPPRSGARRLHLRSSGCAIHQHRERSASLYWNLRPNSKRKPTSKNYSMWARFVTAHCAR